MCKLQNLKREILVTSKFTEFKLEILDTSKFKELLVRTNIISITAEYTT